MWCFVCFLVPYIVSPCYVSYIITSIAYCFHLYVCMCIFKKKLKVFFLPFQVFNILVQRAIALKHLISANTLFFVTFPQKIILPILIQRETVRARSIEDYEKKWILDRSTSPQRIKIIKKIGGNHLNRRVGLISTR